MKIKQTILDLVDNPQARTRIALALVVGEQMIAIHMRQNKENGRLTKMDALMAISKETGVRIEDLLEVSKEEEVPQS
jgi:hypothetical protein